MKSKALEYIFIALGAFMVAFAVRRILVPCRITSGGVSGLGTVFLYLLRIPMSLTSIVINSILLLSCMRELGRASLYKTGFGIVSMGIFLELCTYLPEYREDTLAAALIGGTIMGLGLGIVIKSGGSTGGSDLAGLLIRKRFPHISVARSILFIDIAVIGLSVLVFFSITLMVYSALAMYVATEVCDRVLSAGSSAKTISIVSTENDKIAHGILDRFQRGVTGIHSRGMYSGKGIITLVCVASARELPGIIAFVKSTDERAFITISDVREVMGEGFSAYGK